MVANVILTDLSTGIIDKVEILDIKNKDSFEYIDNEGGMCKMSIFEDGIFFTRKCMDHYLELDLHQSKTAKITSPEGIVKIDTKVVDFSKNNDILVMRYIIDDNEREIKIIYRS